MSQTDLIIHDEKDNVAVVVIDKTTKLVNFFFIKIKYDKNDN